MSAKVRVQELDGSEFLLKSKLGKMLVGAGYAVNRSRGLIVMVAVTLSYALGVIATKQRNELGGLKPESLPQCILAEYPVVDRLSSPLPFGAHQDWDYFPSPKL